jgi:hypothetical protein
VSTGRYDLAFIGAGALCLSAAALSLAFRRGTPPIVDRDRGSTAIGQRINAIEGAALPD